MDSSSIPLSPICCFHSSSFHSSCPAYPPLLPCTKHIPVQGLCNMMFPLPHTLSLQVCMVLSFPMFFCFLRVTFPNHPIFSHFFTLDPLFGLFSLTVLVVCEKNSQMCFFSSCQSILQLSEHQLSVLKSSSILSLRSDSTDSGLRPTAHPSLQMPVTCLGSPDHPVSLSIKSEDTPQHPPLVFDNFLEWLTELRRKLYLLLLVYYKGYNSGTAK